jgi:hypothetical protein
MASNSDCCAARVLYSRAASDAAIMPRRRSGAVKRVYEKSRASF